MTMDYSSIQPPFDLKFREMSKADLVAYREWFHTALRDRTAELARAVKNTTGFESWAPDLTPDSLGPLGDWFRRNAETRKRTDAESGEIKARLSFPIEISGDELTNRTFSLAMDIGMYFGQVIVKNVPGTKWDQIVKNPRFADYGQPVIAGFGNLSLNPVRIAVTLAYAFTAGEQQGSRLRALFDIWSAKRA
jgi:hypothetical protein